MHLSNYKLFNLDYKDFFCKVEGESIDLAIIDPPYNLKVADWDKFKNHESFLRFTYDWIDRLIPKLKTTASFYVFNTPFNAAYILNYLVSKGLVFQNWIVWDKRDGFNYAKKRYVAWQETILFFTVSNQYTFNVDSVRVPYESTSRIEHAKKKGILKDGKRWYPNEYGKLCGDIWNFSSERHKTKINGKTQKTLHVTPKPLDMIERMVIASSNQHDLVLDCFMGSGTSAVAALKHKRDFIGNDKDESFVNYTKSRIDQYYESLHGGKHGTRIKQLPEMQESFNSY